VIIAETEFDDIKYRISQQDEINVVLEKFDAPHIGKRGRGAGKMTKGKWITLGYYGNAQAAAKAIVTWGVSHIPGSFQDVIFALNQLEQKFEAKMR